MASLKDVPAPHPAKTWVDPDTVVVDFIEALVATTPHLRRLDGFPEIKVVFDQTHNKDKVAVISGGGSGHEPAHAGLVGPGLLTAAVAGEIFASPSAEAILAAILTVSGPAGCLVVVKNYTGDRVNFGLAVEQAKALDVKVELVAVGEDVAIESPGIAGRRGLAGSALVHKVAGAAAARGDSLEQVAALARGAAGAMATLGVSLGVCTLPGKEVQERLSWGEVEIGLGIHGEPGRARHSLETAPELVRRVLTYMVESPHCRDWAGQAGRRVVLLVNNLGGASALELTVAAGQALRQLKTDFKLKVERVHVGPYVTSLDMHGMSVTLLDLDNGFLPAADILALLDAPAEAAGWRSGSATVSDKVPQAMPPAMEDQTEAGPDSGPPGPSGEVLGRAIRAACDAIIASVDHINELDKKVGDGDCGDTVALGARAMLKELDENRYPLSNAAATAARAGQVVRKSVGGTSGALYALLLTTVATTLKASSGSENPTPAAWAAALQAGIENVSKYSGAKAGSRSMLDALLPAAKVLAEKAKAGASAAEAAKAAADAATEGAEATKEMVPAVGRSSYVPREVTRTVADPGALVVAIWMRAVAEAMA